MPNRINHNLPINSANQNVQQTHLLTKANEKHDAIKTASESTNTKLDQFSGAINNSSIGDGTVKLQTYCYGHDVANGQARALKVDANGRLECNVADIELHTGDIALSVDGLEALIGTTNSKLQSDLDFAGQPNSIGDGSNMKRVMNYGHDSAAGQQRPLKVDGDGHLQVDILSSAAPTGTATEATLSAAEVHLGNIETAVQLSDDVVTAQSAAHPGKANAVGGRYYVDNTFRDIRVDDIGKVIVDSPAGSDINTRLDNINTNATTLNGKITQGSDATIANATQFLAYGRDQNSGNLNALNVDNGGHLKITLNDIESGITNSIKVTNDNITKGADLTLTEAQQCLSYGIDAFNTSVVEPLRLSGDKLMVQSFIASVDAGITNSLPIKDMRSWNTIVTLSSSLSVPNGGNNDSAIISNNKISDIYLVQIQCDDNTYTDFNAEILESIDASNYKSTYQIMQGMTPAFFIFESIQRVAPNWKVRVNNTGASTKTFTIKYIKAG